MLRGLFHSFATTLAHSGILGGVQVTMWGLPAISWSLIDTGVPQLEGASFRLLTKDPAYDAESMKHVCLAYIEVSVDSSSGGISSCCTAIYCQAARL